MVPWFQRLMWKLGWAPREDLEEAWHESYCAQADLNYQNRAVERLCREVRQLKWEWARDREAFANLKALYEKEHGPIPMFTVDSTTGAVQVAKVQPEDFKC